MRLSSLGLLGLALVLTACRPNPSDDDGSSDGGSDDGGSDDGGSTGDGSTGDGGTGDGGSDDGGSTGDGCSDPTDLGSWFGTIDPGLATTADYDFSAGVADLAAAVPAQYESAKVEIVVDGAIVTNLGYPETSNFWFQDGDGAMRTFATEVGKVAIGDAVRFTVTEIYNYGGEAEITGLTDFEILSSGNPVQVVEAHGQALDYATEAMVNQHVWGQIIEEKGNCGGSANCYTLDNGGADVRIRASDALDVYTGECFEFVAPLNYYDPNTQLVIEDFDWQRLYY